jgi:type VI secretion system protein ImpG
VADELLSYYERELSFLRQMGAEFAEKYPKIAARLTLEPNRCEDPHVERLLEGFSFLAARVHKKIDDEFPEITEALLSILFPHYIRPVPSMSVVEFHADPEQGKLSTGYTIPRGAALYSRPVQGVPCRFRTCYDTVIWPLQVSAAQWTSPERLDPPLKAQRALAACRISLTCSPDVRFEALDLKSLRLYLNGESHLIHSLYELLFNNCIQILVRDPAKGGRGTPLSLPVTCLQPLGFREEEALLPYPRRSFIGYRLLQEYFAFPEKFFFIELSGLDRLAAAGFGQAAEIILLFSPFERVDRQQMLEVGVSPHTFRLNCSPVVNLFQQTAEPILLEETRADYPVVPDARRRRAVEIFSIDEVVSSNTKNDTLIHFEPFYSIRHTSGTEKGRAFWHAVRKRSGFDEGTEMSLSLLDLAGRPVHPEVDALTVRCTCTNRNLPERLPFGGDGGDFELEGASIVRRIVALRRFSPSLRPPSGKSLLWRLISHLSLNYLSMVEEGREALQEILRLYNFSGSTYLERQVNGITQLQSRKHFARVISDHGIHMVRGVKVDLELDEDQFVGGGAFLFSQVVECFLGMYASMNSFSQLSVKTLQRKEVLKQWPPRAGHRILL